MTESVICPFSTHWCIGQQMQYSFLRPFSAVTPVRTPRHIHRDSHKVLNKAHHSFTRAVVRLVLFTLFDGHDAP